MLDTVKMSSICDVLPICDKGVIYYFGGAAFFEPVLSTSTPVTDFHHFPDQICYNPPEKRPLCGCWCRLGDQKQQHPNIFSIFSATKEKVRFEREQFCVLCLDKGVVSQATDNRFTLMKAWAALHSLLQRLLSVGKWISLPLLLWFCL